jgi:hypothetical protein
MLSGLGQQFTSLTGQANYLSSQSQMYSQIAGMGFGLMNYGIGQGGGFGFNTPVYNQENLQRAASGLNLAGGF